MKPGQDEVWKAIQAQKQQGDGDHTNNKAPPIRSTVSWSAILLSDDQKVVLQDSPPPYIHPLLKKSSSCCLSKHSLQICTESLGSETGSDSSSFPPPLPSLANSSVQLRSHQEGEGEVEGSRLILEAVSIPQRNYFHAERSHGRLLLTALTSPSSSHEEEEEASDEEGEGEGSGHATMPSFNSNTNHLYSNSGSSRSISIAEYKQQQQELLRNCKEARRRSLLTWEPPNYCIATSS
nr:protein FAF-like, chloroplastic [Ipomoea batatas]